MLKCDVQMLDRSKVQSNAISRMCCRKGNDRHTLQSVLYIVGTWNRLKNILLTDCCPNRQFCETLLLVSILPSRGRDALLIT